MIDADELVGVIEDSQTQRGFSSQKNDNTSQSFVTNAARLGREVVFLRLVAFVQQVARAWDGCMLQSSFTVLVVHCSHAQLYDRMANALSIQIARPMFGASPSFEVSALSPAY